MRRFPRARCKRKKRRSSRFDSSAGKFSFTVKKTQGECNERCREVVCDYVAGRNGGGPNQYATQSQEDQTSNYNRCRRAGVEGRNRLPTGRAGAAAAADPGAAG